MSETLAVASGLLAIILLLSTPDSLVYIFGCVVVFVLCAVLHVKKMWKEEGNDE